MQIIPTLLQEMEQEAQTTRKMLALIPDDKHDWKPHHKSMSMGNLAVHIAELPSWVSMALTTDGLDFATAPHAPTVVKNNKELLALLEKSVSEGKAELEKARLDQMDEPWILRSGDEIYGQWTRYETIRVAYCQTVHHRAQLGVYLRLLNIPIPGSYGPSADEQSFN
jgi:uncharacterized damage-inducible protein DinB